MRHLCYPHACAISIGYWFSGERIMNMMRLIVVGGYSRFFPCINLLLMVVTVPWPPASSGIVQSVSLRWEGCPRSATVMILLFMTIRWRLVYVCTRYICKVIFTHWYLLKSVLSQGQINYLYNQACSGAERLRRRRPRCLLAGTPGLQYFSSLRRPVCGGAVLGAGGPFLCACTLAGLLISPCERV